MIKLYLSLFTALFLLCPATGNAQNTPFMPEPIKALELDGTQIKYLGEAHGLHGWAGFKGGQIQYFYAAPDGKGILTGMLFDKDGQNVTIKQLQALQTGKDGKSLDMLMTETNTAAHAEPNKEFMSPAQQMYASIEESNWIILGNPNAPYIYTFIDPQCPHCHGFINDLRKNFLPNGTLQLRIIPIGFTPETMAQAAFLLAAPDAEQRLYKHVDGDKTALPINPDINNQGIQRNLLVMQSWDLNVTPLTVYKNKNGNVKIVQGRAQNAASIVNDLQ